MLWLYSKIIKWHHWSKFMDSPLHVASHTQHLCGYKGQEPCWIICYGIDALIMHLWPLETTNKIPLFKQKNLNRIEGIDGECMETSLTNTTNTNDSFWQIQIWTLHRNIIIPATPLPHYHPGLSSAFQIYTNEMVPTILVSPKLDQEGSSKAITYFRIGILKAKGSNWKRLDGIPCWVDVWKVNCLWTNQWNMVSFMYITHSTLR